MRTAETVQQIAQNQAEHVIDSGVVRAIRGQYIDIVLDGTRKQVREVLLSNTITNIDVGWWVVVARVPRTNRWVALSALESMGQGTTEGLIGQPTPANAAATGKPYLIELYWDGSFKDTATYEVQHNSSASETGATNIKVEGSNYFYWCAPGTTRYFRVRAVASSFERSSWSDWVNATSDTGEAYMTVGVNAGATAPEWQAFDWDNVSVITGADMVHSHVSNAEGGKTLLPDWIGVAVTGVPDQQGAIALGSVAADPSVIGGAGIIYAKDFSGIPELCYVDDTGNVVQITSGGGLPGVSDHGGLTGLGDDDHTIYLLADGTRALTGNMAVNAGVTIDSVDIGAHQHTGSPADGVQVAHGSLTSVTADQHHAGFIGLEDNAAGVVTPDTDDRIQFTDDGVINVDAHWSGNIMTFWVAQSLIDHGTIGGLADDDHAQYLLASGTRALTGAWDVGAFLVTFGAGITFDGASGANEITFPDNVAIAGELRDDGGVPIEYMRIVSTDAQPVVHFNQGEADIDTIIGASGITNALLIRGSDGYVGMGCVPQAKLSLGGAVVLTIGTDSVDGADGRVMRISSSGVAGASRGAYLDFGGNEHGSAGGITFIAGTAGGDIIYYSGAASAERLRILGASGYVSIGPTLAVAQLHVNQPSTVAAVPVLLLDQADISEEMIEFATTIGVGNAIEAVGAKTLTTTHFIKIVIPGALTRYIPVGTIA